MLRVHRAKQEEITVNPIPYESVTLFNTQNGFASFLVPAILILVIQQTLVLGIGMLGGTAREKNRFHSLVPISRHFNGTLPYRVRQVSDLYLDLCSCLHLGISRRAETLLPASSG